jgi:hypothetical protein
MPRLLGLSTLVAVASSEVPRELGFNFGNVQMSGNGAPNPFSAMMSSMMQQGQNGAGGTNPWSYATNQPGNPWAQGNSNTAAKSPSSNPFDSSGSGGFGFDDNPFGNFGDAGKKQAAAGNNFGLGGPPLNPQTGSEIMQSMIDSFLAHRQLQQGERDCLVSGTGAMGGQVAEVSSNMMAIAKQMIALEKMGTQGGAAPSSGANPFRSLAMQESQPARQLQGGMMMEAPAMLMGGTMAMMSLGNEMNKIMQLGHQILSTCLQGDGKAAFQQAIANAKSLSYVSSHVMTNGVDMCEELSGALSSWEKGDTKGFGDNMGTMARKMFLSSDTNGKLPEGLPDKKALMNVTGGFLKGFFGPGMEMEIRTPETGSSPIEIDLNKCVGKNVNLLENMWSSTMYFYGQQSTGGAVVSTRTPQGRQEFATMLAYTMMQLPRAMQQCNINNDQKQMLVDAIKGMGSGTSFKFDMPQGEDLTKMQAMSQFANSVSDYEKLVKDPNYGMAFGKNLGLLFQEAAEKAFEKKYMVDDYGNLRMRLTELSEGNWMSATGANSLMTPVLLVLTVLVLLGAIVALKSRRALAGWKNHWCQDAKSCTKSCRRSGSDLEDIEAADGDDRPLVEVNRAVE